MEGNKSALTLTCEIFIVLWILLLLFLQIEEGLTDQCAKGLIVEVPYRHFVHLTLLFNKLQKVFKHLGWVATLQSLLIVFGLWSILRLNLGVEFYLVLELLVLCGLRLVTERNFDFSQLGRTLHHLCELTPSFRSPLLLMVGSFSDYNLFQWIIGFEQLCYGLQSLICDYSHIEL